MVKSNRYLTFFTLIVVPASVAVVLSFHLIAHAQSAQMSQNSHVSAYVHIDIDYDGIPNWWEIKYGFDSTNPADAALDFDTDRLTNLEEYIFGSDPTKQDTDCGSLWDIREKQQGKNPNDPSDDLKPERYSSPPEAPEDIRGDSDGDGLSNETEQHYGTNPHKIDTDGDDLNDFEELFTYNSNPNDIDTDKDGIKDGLEVHQYKTNPTMRDSDFDGLLDSEEVFTYQTNPNLWDTDSGGMSDNDELINKSDPLVEEDDYQFVWSLYYGEKPNELFNTLKNNKIDIYDGMGLTLEAITPSDAKSVTISYNDKTLKTEKPYVNLKLLSPKKAGIYTIGLTVELKNDKVITFNKYVEVRQRGQVIRHADGNFNNLYNKIDYFKTKPADDAKIEVLTYDDVTKKMKPFISDIFPSGNPSYTDSGGRYYIVLHPGNYLIRISKLEFGTKEILFNTDKFTIFSEDVSLSYNYDAVVWGVVFMLVFILVWQVLSLISQLRYWVTRIIRPHPHEVY